MNSINRKSNNNSQYGPRGPSPNQRIFDSPNSFGEGGQTTINVNLRKNLLEQCDDQYEKTYTNKKKKGLYDDEEDDEEEEKQIGQRQQNRGVNQYQSPYQKRNEVASVSPNRYDVDETIQGNIDGQMSEEQIKNKKAFIWAFGKNQEGELALGVYKDVLVPRFITGLKGNSAKWISSSNHHTSLITGEGLLMVSGSSLHGKLGIDIGKTNINKLQIVPALQKRKAKQVSCGDYHTLVLLEDGTVYQFGGSSFNSKKDKIQRPQNSQVAPNVPQPVQALYGKDIVEIDCGDFHSAALDANGDLYTWGGGTAAYNKGQCGHGNTNAIEIPEKVKYLSSKRIVKIACGGFHTLALSSENELYAFGSGSYGECGYGEYLDTNKPKLVKFPNDFNDTKNVTQEIEEYGDDEEFVLDMYLKEQPVIVQIAAGGRHSMVLTNKGKVFTFGYGTNGQLGHRNTSNQAKPVLVKDLLGKHIVQIAAGWNHSLALTEKGDLYGTGYGAHGQLGIGEKESKTQFTYVAPLGNKNITKIFAGGSHTWVVLDPLVPIKENWRPPSPLKQYTQDTRSFSNTPMRHKSDYKQPNSTLLLSSSANKPYSNNNLSPFQNLVDNHQNKQSIASANFGGASGNNLSFNKNSQKGIQSSASQLGLGNGDDFIQRIIEMQSQQLMKAQYFLQITYCETEFCHRFVNFEVHDQFVKQFENLLEEFIQLSYQQEKGILYHKIQEVPQEFFQKKTQMTLGDKLLKDQYIGQREEDSELDESFAPEDGHKAYTLCIICNPSACNYESQLNDYKRSSGINGKTKKIVVNSSLFQGNDENQVPLIGKIVFLKDSDLENNQFEESMASWMINFHRKLAKYCIKRPRYSELRPMKYSLT